MKPYLYYTQHEHDDKGNPVTALYLAPKEAYAHDKEFGKAYDTADKKTIDRVASALGMTERTEWVLESYDLTPPQIIHWMSGVAERYTFSTSDKYALACKTGEHPGAGVTN